MVGRLALAAASLPDKDGDVQPCKKRREEDASVKTITRYFSPLAKTGDKVLSPPKPNNILDYFKKTCVTEKAMVPAVAGENKAQFDGDDKDCKSHHKPPSKLKRKRKRVNLNNKLREMKEPENEGAIEFNCDDSRETTELKQDSNDFTATCTLVDQNCVGESAEDNTQGENFSDADIYGKSMKKVGSEINAVKNRIRKSRKRKHKVYVDLSESFSFENQLNEECKKETKDNKMIPPEIGECDAITISDSSFDADTDKALQVNSSTITVSFEDFLRSQGEHNVDHAEEGTKPILGNSVTATEMDKSGSTSDPEKCEESQQVPLRTVTVLAQVHSIPPKLASLHREQKGSMKIASIFLKQKGCIGEKESSPPLLESEQTEHITQKRKSNVVIEEEELELAVLETTGSDPLKTKSALEERHQFMKAFRQPTSDVIKSGVKKAPGKPKQVTGKSSKDKKGSEGDIGSNKGLESGVPEDCVDKHMHSHPGNHRTKTKRPKNFQKNGNRRRKALEAKEKCVLNTSDYNEEKDSGANLQTKENNLNVKNSSSPKVNKLRRSLRQKKVDTYKTVTPKKNRIRNTFSEDESVCPLQTSTPKTSKQSLKKNMYKAEVITVPSDANSPIRMRFTRINATLKSNKGEAMKNEDLNSKNIKISSTSKNISKAKQLVEKAKAIRHNRSKVNEDLTTPVRRSSRQQALAEKKQLQENEKSAITIHSSLSNATTTMQNVKQKNLRSLNDVLGKKSRNMKAKNSNGKLGYPSSFLGKNTQKSADEPIVIFDESSQDASENSQDDDQFRSKREFLMSGLPELLKRQIAKKAAATEAYSLASLCFKTVVHVQQKDDCHPMWKLKSPLCPLLTKLRKLSTEVTNVTKITISLGEFSTVRSELTGNCSAPVFSGHRSVLPDAVRKGLLDEIVSSNSQFPVRKYLYAFLRRQTERLLFENSTQESRDGASNSEVNQKHSDNWKETKRKRKETEDHKSKRRKQVEGTESELKSRVSRNLTAPVSGGKQAAAAQATHFGKNKNQKPDIMIEDNEYLSEPNALSGVEKEDMLWTEKYQPQDSSELVGNRKEIERLHSWLKEWKKRADWEEKRNQKGEKEDKEHQDSLDSLDFKGNESDIEEEINLCNTVLITGPPGVGKTAAVYACAQELGFKIFEVNASCQRSGRQVLSQLREATQSHQVDKKGINAHKPCFFNSCSSAKSPKKTYSPKKVISPRKPPLSPKGAGLKRNLPPKTLANYFKMPSKYKGNDGTITSQEKNKVLHRSAGNVQSSSEEKDAQIKSINKEVEGGEQNRKSATSLILFEEVDIIFDEDAGFLSAIKTFMATAKRPVILTTNDPTFSLMFDGYFEEINFRTPSLINAASYLQALCLAENLRTDVKDLAALLTTNNCDIRQSVLFLQFWVKSGGGYLKDKCLALHGEDEINKADQVINSEKATDSKIEVSQADAPLQEFPKCDTGCVETLLGLRNILLPSEDLFTFLKQKITTMEKWDKLIQLLTEFQLKTVDFIYSNLELLLPLPVHYLSNQSEASNSTLERTTIVSSKNKSINSYCSRKKSKKTKNKKRLDVLDDSDLFDTELNYSAEFLSLPSDSPTSCAEANSEESKLMMNREGKDMKSKTPANDKRSALVCQCLNSLTEFVENMSFLDCCVNSNTREPLEFSKDEGFKWTNGKIKNGLCDEFSIENTDWWSSQSCSEIKAAIEALSFNKCSVSISQKLETSLSSSKTPESDQLEGLTMHISNTRNYVSFNQSADSSIHEKAQKRLAVIRTIFSRTPLNLGNKQASVLEYLPTLRSICRSEKIKEQGKTKRRFLHYLEGIHLEIPRQMMHSLSLDFP